MAETQAEVCVACAQPVSVTSNRRRFRSASSSHVLPTLSEIIGQLDSAASSAILDPQGPAFVCWGCFSSLEKLKKVRAEASQIDARLESGVRQFSELLGRKDGASTIRAATEQPSEPSLTTTPRGRKRPLHALASPVRQPPAKRRLTPQSPSRRFLQQVQSCETPAVAVSIH